MKQLMGYLGILFFVVSNSFADDASSPSPKAVNKPESSKSKSKTKTGVYIDTLSDTPAIENSNHKKHEIAVGAVLLGGYNVINHVDGVLSSIPNKGDSTLSPTFDGSTTVYSLPLSVDINVAALVEYWLSSSWSIRAELGFDLIVAGCWNATSNFAYIYTYLKASFGGRYYFDKFHLGAMFIGAGFFGSFPIAKPLIGFVSAPDINAANITGGPYAEFGVNYPVNRHLNLEAFIRFSFNINNLSDKSNSNIYTDVNVSPLSIGFGVNYRIL